MNSKIKIPAKVFTKCPNCSAKIFYIDDDCLCTKCDWLSAKAHVESGGMDFGPFTLKTQEQEAVYECSL